MMSKCGAACVSKIYFVKTSIKRHDKHFELFISELIFILNHGFSLVLIFSSSVNKIMESYCLSHQAHQIKLIDAYSLSFIFQVMFNLILLQNSLTESKGIVIFHYINIFCLNIWYKLIKAFIFIKIMIVFADNFLEFCTYLSWHFLRKNYTLK